MAYIGKHTNKMLEFMKNNSKKTQTIYSILAIPAIILPISYCLMALWVITSIFPSVITGETAELPDKLRIILLVGIYGTFIQWPIYALWVALSKELSFRLKLLWWLVLFFLNMFAIPWFLYCKYKGTTRTAIIKIIKRKPIRQFFQQTNN